MPFLNWLDITYASDIRSAICWHVLFLVVLLCPKLLLYKFKLLVESDYFFNNLSFSLVQVLYPESHYRSVCKAEFIYNS